MAWTTPRTWSDGELVPDTMLNVHIRDNFNALNPITDSTYVVDWTAASVNPSLGTGTKSGRYYAIGNYVFFKIAITMGSTTTFGTGTYSFSLPLTSASGSGVTGMAWLRDNGTNYRVGVVVLASSSTVQVYADSDVAGIDPTKPFTWADGDQLMISGVYVKTS